MAMLEMILDTLTQNQNRPKSPLFNLTFFIILKHQTAAEKLPKLVKALAVLKSTYKNAFFPTFVALCIGNVRIAFILLPSIHPLQFWEDF